MKRTAVEKYDYLWKLYPVFLWYKCCECGKEFRREKGWRAVTAPFMVGPNGSRGIDRYLCADCGPDWETANKYFLEEKWMGEIGECPFPVRGEE